MKLSELLTDESKWCKGQYAILSNGEKTWDYSNPTACQWCLKGAMMVCGIPDDVVSGAIVELGLRRRHISFNGNRIVASFNDHPDTTFQEIKRVIEKIES